MRVTSAQSGVGAVSVYTKRGRDPDEDPRYSQYSSALTVSLPAQFTTSGGTCAASRARTPSRT